MNRRPVYLTAAGREHLEARLAQLVAQRARLTRRGDEEPTDVQDTVDESSRLQERDEQSQLEDRIADVRQTLERAQPVPSALGTDVVSLGFAVHARTPAGDIRSYRLVDRAEVGTTPDDVAADSPIGRALEGRRAGETIDVDTPDGVERLTLVSVIPY
jgi:transcription elongation GreA/GreB family factor